MSYDLYFWKQIEACDLLPEVVIRRFSEEQPVDGLQVLPVSDITARIKREFPDMREERLEAADRPIQLVWEHESDGCFVAHPSSTYLCIESHQATSEILNRLIDIAAEFDCPLYDPKTNTRYTD